MNNHSQYSMIIAPCGPSAEGLVWGLSMRKRSVFVSLVCMATGEKMLLATLHDVYNVLWEILSKGICQNSLTVVTNLLQRFTELSKRISHTDGDFAVCPYTK